MNKHTWCFRCDGSGEICNCCCVYCNRAKSDLSIEEFKKHIAKIYKGFVCEN